jgi:hypothetical protein
LFERKQLFEKGDNGDNDGNNNGAVIVKIAPVSKYHGVG